MALTETAGESAPARRPPWALGLRLVVSAALLAILVSKIDIDSALPRQRHLSTLLFFVAGLGFAALGIALSAWRWQKVLDVFGIHVPLRTLTGHYFAGQFVGNVLPSTIGGDVLRVSRVSKTIGSDATAFASVALERLTGFVALPLLCFVGFMLEPSLLDTKRAWLPLLISGITLVALVGILLLAAHPRLAGRFRDHENWMRFIGSVHVGVDELRRNRGRAWSVLGTALLYQLSTLAVVWSAVHTLDVSLPQAAIIAFAPAVAMAQVLPLSLSGLGVREGMLVLLLTPLGATTGQAVGIGLLWYCMMLLVSLGGAPAFAVGGRRPGIRHGHAHASKTGASGPEAGPEAPGRKGHPEAPA